MFMASPRASGGTLAATITRASSKLASQTYTSKHSTWTVTWSAHGFDAGADYYIEPGFGSINDATIGGNTIASIYWADYQFLFFSLDGINVANTDQSFYSLKFVGGSTYLRSAATYVASKNGGTHWYWALAANPIGASQAIEVVWR